MIAVIILASAFAYLIYGSDVNVPWGGVAVLLGIPFATGMLIGETIDRSKAMGCFVWPTLAIVCLVFVGYVIFGEGVICIAIAMPLWIAAAIGGALTSVWNHWRWNRGDRSREPDDNRLRLAAWTILPVFLLAAESVLPPTWTEHEVVREIVVNANPATVWPQLIEIRHVAADEGQWTFTQNILSVPRPLDARLETMPTGKVRKAIWGEGIRFEEHVTSETPNSAMDWRFVFPDKSLQNHTDRHIEPDGQSLRILSGSYRLESLAGGRTRIRLTTHYAMRTHLPGYMELWSERLLGDVQSNVLRIIAGRVAI